MSRCFHYHNMHGGVAPEEKIVFPVNNLFDIIRCLSVYVLFFFFFFLLLFVFVRFSRKRPKVK